MFILDLLFANLKCSQCSNSFPHHPTTNALVSFLSSRDDFNRKFNSTSGTFSSNHPKPPARSPGAFGSSTNICTSTFTSELCSLMEDESDRRFPDLLENSPPARTPQLKSKSKACSEGGSVSDITDLFCTLPRKRALAHNSRYKSTDSQSPLLPESRYGSDSSAESCSSSSRRLSDCQKYPFSSLGRSRVSNSYLNLTSTRSSLSPAAVAETPPSSTPLLDVSSLENRVQFRPEVLVNPPSTVASSLNAYDYHAAQLERFLEEYRSLQKQLTKMKETCGALRNEKMSVDNLLQHSLPVTPSSDESFSRQLRRSGTKPSSPNANTLDNAVDGYGASELTKYLLSKSPTPNSMNSGVFKS